MEESEDIVYKDIKRSIRRMHLYLYLVALRTECVYVWKI